MTLTVSEAPLTVTLMGTGSGSVNSSPARLACTSGSCSSSFAAGTLVTLLQTPSSGSIFAGWGGACSGTGSCSVTMDGAKSVTATFNATPKAMVGTKGFSTLQAAYDDPATVTGSVIRLLEGTQAGGLHAGRGIRVTVAGGYNAAYSGAGGRSTLEEPVKVKAGAVVMRGVALR